MINTVQIDAAVYTRLTNDAGVTALVPAGSIGSHLPQDVTYPHILFRFEEEDLGIKSEGALSCNLVIDVWSDTKGEKEVRLIRDAVYTALQDTPLTIASGDAIGSTFTNFISFLEPDGVVHHGVLNFNLLYGDS